MHDGAQRSRVKLAVVTTVHRWGDPRVFERNARAALDFGLEVHAFVPANGELELPEWARSERFKLHILPLPQNRLRRAWLALSISTYLSQAGEFDAIHFHDPELIPAMWWLSQRRPKTAFLYDVHEELPLEVFSKSHIPKALRPGALMLARILWFFAARRFHAFAPATEAIARYWPPERCRVVHNYPKSIFNLPDGERSRDLNRVIFVGGLAQIRGIRELLAAVRSLRTEFPELELELYGRLADSQLGALVERACGEGWCTHVPWMSPPELAQRISCAGIGTAPYHPVLDHLEALPTKIFEYMALGIPVLISDFPLWQQIVEGSRAGICVVPNEDGIREGLRSLLLNPAALEEYSRNGRAAYRDHYRWEAESSNLRWLYDKLGLRTIEPCAS